MTYNIDEQCEELQPQLAAYALGEAEAEPAMLEHLANCPNCQRDLRAYLQVAQVLPYDAPEVAPPAALRQRILAAATPPPRPAPARRPRRIQAGWAAFACALALVVALLGWNISLRNELAAQETLIARSGQSWQLLIGLMNDPLVHWYTVSGDSARGHFWTTPSGQVGCLIAQNLPALAGDQTYQVWLERDREALSGGTFEEREGGGWIMIKEDQPLENYSAVRVTVEPRGGSATPTGRQVLYGKLVESHWPQSSADRQELLRLLPQPSTRSD